MKRTALGVFFTSALTLLTGTAHAITNGQFDDELHPYVGVIALGTEVGGQFVQTNLCSGSLLSPNVMLTAGHCTFNVSAARVWFTPTIGDGPPIVGHPLTHPDFCAFCGPGLVNLVSHDVGVVLLDTPVEMGEYAVLPSPGLVDTLPMHTALTIVGYGAQFQTNGPPPHEWLGFGTRRFADSLLIASNEQLSEEFLQFTLNPAQGKGGACLHDSGGPNLLEDTNIVLAISSFPTNTNCAGVGHSARIDLPDILSFVQSFL